MNLYAVFKWVRIATIILLIAYVGFRINESGYEYTHTDKLVVAFVCIVGAITSYLNRKKRTEP